MRSHRLGQALRALWQAALSLDPTRPVRLRKLGALVVVTLFAACLALWSARELGGTANHHLTWQPWKNHAANWLLPTVAARDISASQLALVSAANYEATVAPDSIASIFGVGLATGTLVGGDSDPNTPGIQLPTQLAGTTVEINGQRAPLFFRFSRANQPTDSKNHHPRQCQRIGQSLRRNNKYRHGANRAIRSRPVY